MSLNLLVGYFIIIIIISLKIPKDKPIAVFSDAKKGHNETKYIDDTHIKSILQEAAKEIYNITCKKELWLYQLWLPHS